MLEVLVAIAKTEITWWAFPVFTKKKKRVTVLELMKNQSSKRLKKQIRCKSEIGNHRLQSGPEKDHNSHRSRDSADVLFDAPGRIIQYGKNGKLAGLNDLF